MPFQIYIAAAVLGLVLAGLIWWGIRTCKSLWRRGSDDWGRLVYNYGVRGYGVAMALFFICGAAYYGWNNLAQSPDARVWCALICAFLAAIFGTPVGLGMGYWWGSSMARYYGFVPTDSRVRGKPKE